MCLTCDHFNIDFADFTNSNPRHGLNIFAISHTFFNEDGSTSIHFQFNESDQIGENIITSRALLTFLRNKYQISVGLYHAPENKFSIRIKYPREP